MDGLTYTGRSKFLYLSAVCVVASGLFIVVLQRAVSTVPHLHNQMKMVMPGPEAYIPAAIPLDRQGWTAEASDSYISDPASNVLDGNEDTFWHSNWSNSTPLPHIVTIDMKSALGISGLSYLPRQDGTPNGNVGQFTIKTSTDGTNFGNPVASGTWADTTTLKEISFGQTTARYVRFTMLTEAGNRGPWSSVAELNILQGEPSPPLMNGGSWSPSIGFPLVPSAAILLPNNKLLAFSAYSTTSFGHGGTIWHSDWENKTTFPHTITLDMKTSRTIAGFTYLPRQDGEVNGTIGKYTILISTDGVYFKSVASGTWADNATLKTVKFTSIKARHVRLKASSEAGNRGPWSSASELNVLDTTYAPFPRAGWTAKASDTYGDDVAGNVLDDNIVKTKFSILDLNNNVVSVAQNATTNHEMFCSGLSLLADGRLLIVGGSSDGATTIYDPYNNTWTGASPLNTPRAYESSVTLSNGKVMTVGGSWNDQELSKNGELYSPGTGQWTDLAGILASSIVTNDAAGIYRADNHAWLFATSGGGVFHAGPSKKMNWMNTAGNGSATSAGLRADSADAMNGNAVMYDIGKILTVGGAPSYQDSAATKRAYTIDITGGPSQPVTTKRVADMAYARAFNNSVVLPDGKVLVVGGQTYAQPFSDSNAIQTPELWDPETNQFTVLAAESSPRTYHSVALLLPDGRVFSGGGGLCGGCATNHLDGQIFTPPYLLNPDGSPRVRPVITNAPGTASLGTAMAVTTNASVAKFALVRMSSVTHSINTDQRRVPIAIVSASSSTYQLAVPADAGTVVPGPYLLFALDANGTPSIAKTILL